MGLVYALGVPGFAVVGLLRLAEPTTEATLSIVSSILLCTIAAQLLAWLDVYSLATTLSLLAAVTVPCLGLQLRALTAEAANYQDSVWPRSYWS